MGLPVETTRRGFLETVAEIFKNVQRPLLDAHHGLWAGVEVACSSIIAIIAIIRLFYDYYDYHDHYDYHDYYDYCHYH